MMDIKGYKIKAPCGRIYYVPIEKVHADYATYCAQEGDGTPEMREDEIHTWFHDNYTWEEVERDGEVIGFASAAQVKTALDYVRDWSLPVDCALATVRVPNSYRPGINRVDKSQANPKPPKFKVGDVVKNDDQDWTVTAILLHDKCEYVYKLNFQRRTRYAPESHVQRML
jgi:hypothetical protein